MTIDRELGRALGNVVKSIKVVGKAADFDDLVAGVTGKRIKVVSWYLTSGGNADNTVQFLDNTTELTGDINVGTGFNGVAPYNPAGWFQTSSGGGLDMDVEGTTPSVDGVVTYIEVEP